jgi:uncharacterized membrane protein YfcA
LDLILVAVFMGLMALLYATVGQAGGTAYVAAMALFAFPPEMIRPTSLLLNVVAAGYATWRLHRAGAIDWSTLAPIAVASLPMAFTGGLLVLPPQTFRTVVGVVLSVAAALTIRRSNHDPVEARPVRLPLAAAIGAAVGLASGLTGVGGGVFLAPLLLIGGWATPRQTVGLSAPFILANSAVAFLATRLAGQSLADGTPIYAIGSLAGAVFGTAIGLRWVSPRMIRVILAAILLASGLRLLVA